MLTDSCRGGRYWCPSQEVLCSAKLGEASGGYCLVKIQLIWENGPFITGRGGLGAPRGEALFVGWRIIQECFLEELGLNWALNDQETLHQQRFGNGATPGVFERSSEFGENETGKLDEVSSGRASSVWPRFWALSRFTDPSSVVWEAGHLRKLKVLS